MNYIIIFFIFTMIIYMILYYFNGKKWIKDGDKKVSAIILRYIQELESRQIVLKGKKWIKPINIIIFSIILFTISILTFNYIIGVLSTAIIISFPALMSPILISAILITNNKRKIIKILPMYVVNLKNYITEENNIIAAMMKCGVEQPLNIFIENFKRNVKGGMNVLAALEYLDKEIGIKQFTDLITGIKLCYTNGGNFAKVLEKYIAIITKEATYREETEEKALSSILTLIVMVGLNIIVTIFILNNKEYASILQATFIGQVILNINVLSYMFIAWLVSRIYKEEY